MAEILQPLYDRDYLQSLQNKVSAAIAKLINKENSSRKLDLNYKFNVTLYAKLVNYKDILEQIMECNDCYKEYDVNKVVSNVLNNLSNV